MHYPKRTPLLVIALLVATASVQAQEPAATALYLERVVALERVLPDPNDLWVAPADLTRINDFVLKPEGACLDDLCIPVRQDEDSAMFVTRSGDPWFNVTELARRLDQAYVHDADTATWSFASMPVVRSSTLERGLAPDFELSDQNGNLVRLRDFRGKKVAIITWASW